MSVAWVGVGVAALGAAASVRAGNQAAGAQRDAANRASNTELTMYDQNRDDLASYRDVGGQALGELAHGLGLARPLSEAQRAAQRPVVVGDSTLPPGTTTEALGGGRYNVMLNGQNVGTLVPGGKNGRFVGNGTPIQAAPAEQADATSQSDGSDAPGAGDFNRDFTLADFHKDPGYDFRLNEGREALEGSASARGGLLNGGTLRALERYGQDYGSSEYSNAYARFNNDRTQRFNRLSALAGTGQTATNTTATLGTNAANNIAETQLQAGNARAANAINTSNAINNTASTLGQFYLSQQYGAKATTPKAVGGVQARNYNGPVYANVA